MKNKYLLSLLAALGFSGCGNNNEIWDEPCYYGPGPVWTPDIIISSQVQNEEKETINGIRVVSSYMNQEDSLITDTAYTESREIEHYTVSGIAINTFKFKEYPPKDTEMYLEYTDVDGEKNGAYQTKKIRIQDLGKEGKVTLLKEEKKEEEKDGGRKIRLLVDFEIRGLGDFQLLADLQDHKISMELGVPKNLSAGAGEIQAKLQEICTRNGMRVKMMQVQERKAHYRLLDVFPKIRKKENGINVSV